MGVFFGISQVILFRNMTWKFRKLYTSAPSFFLGSFSPRKSSGKYISNISLGIFLGKCFWGYILEVYPGISFESLHKIVIGSPPWKSCVWEPFFEVFDSKIHHAFLVCFYLSCVVVISLGKTWETIWEHPLGNLSWKSLLETALSATTNSTLLDRPEEHAPYHPTHIIPSALYSSKTRPISRPNSDDKAGGQTLAT